MLTMRFVHIFIGFHRNAIRSFSRGWRFHHARPAGSNVFMRKHKCSVIRVICYLTRNMYHNCCGIFCFVRQQNETVCVSCLHANFLWQTGRMYACCHTLHEVTMLAFEKKKGIGFCLETCVVHPLQNTRFRSHIKPYTHAHAHAHSQLRQEIPNLCVQHVRLC